MKYCFLLSFLILIALGTTTDSIGIEKPYPASNPYTGVTAYDSAKGGNRGQQSLPSPQIQIPAGVRMLVFSPHPDDETLAAGGLIQRVLESGGQARVVFVTNGDAYLKGVRSLTGRSQISNEDCINYGVRRQAEAVRATARLGLEDKYLIFFGFPDQGIDNLWEDYPSPQNPFTSPYTSYDHPYISSLVKPVKYDGADLDGEIEQIMADFSPNYIVLPDPRDKHPDHSATGIFVLKAISRSSRTTPQKWANTQILTYLVHFPGYPQTDQWVNRIRAVRSPVEPAVLAPTHWLKFRLSPKEVALKKEAIGSYQSQLKVLGGLMRKFLGSTETFGILDNSQVSKMSGFFGRRVVAR